MLNILWLFLEISSRICMGDLFHNCKGGSWQGKRRETCGEWSQQDLLWSKSSSVPAVWPCASEHKNHFDQTPWHLILFFSLWNNLIREIVLLRKQVTQLGAGKESLARLSHDLREKWSVREGPWGLQRAMAKVFTRGCWELRQKKSNEGVEWTAAVGVSISPPLLVSNELSPHLVGNSGW